MHNIASCISQKQGILRSTSMADTNGTKLRFNKFHNQSESLNFSMVSEMVNNKLFLRLL